MTNSMIKNIANLESLSSTLFLSLDESHFFCSIGSYFKVHMNSQKVQIFKILDNGQSVLV